MRLRRSLSRLIFQIILAAQIKALVSLRMLSWTGTKPQQLNVLCQQMFQEKIIIVYTMISVGSIQI